MNTAQERREVWFLSRLADHGVVVDEGTTTREERGLRARQAIDANGLGPVVMCRGKSGRPLTYNDVFPTVYPT